jgi:hypothetical protein
VDYETELATVQCILDASTNEGFSPLAESLTECGKLTSWVSLQLSLLALQAAKEGRADQSSLLGIASFEAALAAGDEQQYYSNILDQVDAMMRLGSLHAVRYLDFLDKALELCFVVINSFSTNADHARPGAHIAVASIYRWLSESGDRPELVGNALYHIERGLRYIHSSVTPEQRKVLLTQFDPLYRQVRDLAGVCRYARLLGNQDVAGLLRRHVRPEMDADDVLALHARLRALEEHELADIVLKAWQEPAQKPTEP